MGTVHLELPKWIPLVLSQQLCLNMLTMWFGTQISISHSGAKKTNMDHDAWFFVIKKNEKSVTLIKNDVLL